METTKENLFLHSCDSRDSWVKFLFVAQRFDWIERGGLARWVKAEKDADRCAEQKCNRDRTDRDERRPIRVDRQNPGRADATDDSNYPANGTERYRFDQELGENVAAVRTDGHAHTDFARPFGDAHEHDIHDTDPADDERDARDCAQQDGHHARSFRGSLRDFLLIAYGKIVVAPGTNIMPLPKQ